MSTAKNCEFERRVDMRIRMAALGLLSALSLTVAGRPCAWSQAPSGNQKADPAPAEWMILFRADDPSVWDTDCRKPNKFAVRLDRAPDEFRYLRLRRMDTGDALILRLSPDQLQNGKAPDEEVGYWWNGTAKKDWEGPLVSPRGRATSFRCPRT